MPIKIKTTLRIFLLFLFLVLLFVGKVQLWAPLFFGSLILSLFFGRFYCGWICPIHTVMEGITFLKKKLRLKQRPLPVFLRSSTLRYGALLLFIGAFLFSMLTGKRLPVLPMAFFLGIFLTALFPELLWHRYLCPYGTFFSKASKRGMNISSTLCNGCSLCSRVCPTEAAHKAENGYVIEQQECLLCGRCQKNCRQGAISYR